MKICSPAGARVLFSIVALAAIAICYSYYSRNVARLAASLDNARSCKRLAGEIDRIRKVPQKARLTTRTTDDLGSVVEKAATEAHIARDRVLRIDPQPAKRLGKTDYLEQATEVELLAVSLRQLVDLIYNLTQGGEELAVGTLRLRMPHEANQPVSQELWLADVVLTQRIYAPTAPARAAQKTIME